MIKFKRGRGRVGVINVHIKPKATEQRQKFPLLHLVFWLLLFIPSSLFLTVVSISHVKTHTPPPPPPPRPTLVYVCASARARFERYISSPYVGVVCHSKEDHYMNIHAPVEVVIPPTPISIDRTDRGFWGKGRRVGAGGALHPYRSHQGVQKQYKHSSSGPRPGGTTL